MKKGAKRRRVSRAHDWCTPQIYVDAVKEFWGGKISLDPCSNQWSLVHAEMEYTMPRLNGLRKTWEYPTIFVNPPYGLDVKRHTSIKNWLLRCAEANEKYSSEVIALIPVATNTSHWKEAIFGKAQAVCFLYETRVKFLEAGEPAGRGAPMACCLVYWGHRKEEFINQFMKFGAVVDLSTLIGVPIGTVIENTEEDEGIS